MPEQIRGHLDGDRAPQRERGGIELVLEEAMYPFSALEDEGPVFRCGSRSQDRPASLNPERASFAGDAALTVTHHDNRVIRVLFRGYEWEEHS